jgi:hypothetical protein
MTYIDLDQCGNDWEDSTDVGEIETWLSDGRVAYQVRVDHRGRHPVLTRLTPPSCGVHWLHVLPQWMSGCQMVWRWVQYVVVKAPVVML